MSASTRSGASKARDRHVDLVGTAGMTVDDDFQNHSLPRCRDSDFPLRTLDLFPTNDAEPTCLQRRLLHTQCETCLPRLLQRQCATPVALQPRNSVEHEADVHGVGHERSFNLLPQASQAQRRSWRNIGGGGDVVAAPQVVGDADFNPVAGHGSHRSNRLPHERSPAGHSRFLHVQKMRKRTRFRTCGNDRTSWPHPHEADARTTRSTGICSARAAATSVMARAMTRATKSTSSRQRRQDVTEAGCRPRGPPRLGLTRPATIHQRHPAKRCR